MTQEYKSEFGRIFRSPSFFAQPLNSGGHGVAQVDGALEALAFDDLPLQVEEYDVARRVGAGVDVVPVSGHQASFANRARSVHSVVERGGYCIESSGWRGYFGH